MYTICSLFAICSFRSVWGTGLLRPGDPKTGSTPWDVLQAIRKKHGMTGSEVVSVVTEGGHKVSEANSAIQLWLVLACGQYGSGSGKHRKANPTVTV